MGQLARTMSVYSGDTLFFLLMRLTEGGHSATGEHAGIMTSKAINREFIFCQIHILVHWISHCLIIR